MQHLIKENIENVLARIAAACLKSNRNPAEVKLLLATKTVAAPNIRHALQLGTTLIAENKIQELKEKYESLLDIPHTNHFIGHLQSNKIKDLLKYNVSCIHSIDKLELATKLNQRLELERKTMDILVQVNTSAEDSKFGIAQENAVELVEQIAQLKNIRIKGLMTIGLFSDNKVEVRKCFQLLKKLQTEISLQKFSGVMMDELSMGMSNDLEIAIEEGSTIIRVGTAIFGKRPTPDSFYWKE